MLTISRDVDVSTGLAGTQRTPLTNFHPDPI